MHRYKDYLDTLTLEIIWTYCDDFGIFLLTFDSAANIGVNYLEVFKCTGF